MITWTFFSLTISKLLSSIVGNTSEHILSIKQSLNKTNAFFSTKLVWKKKKQTKLLTREWWSRKWTGSPRPSSARDPWRRQLTGRRSSCSGPVTSRRLCRPPAERSKRALRRRGRRRWRCRRPTPGSCAGTAREQLNKKMF